VIIDVATSYGLTGRQAESALLDAGVVTNRNSIPADPNGPWYTSGIRLGTPALTTLGLGPTEMDEIADIIAATLSGTSPASSSSGPSKAHYILDDITAATLSGTSPASSSSGPSKAHYILDDITADTADAARPNCSTGSPPTLRYSYRPPCRWAPDKDNAPISRPTSCTRVPPTQLPDANTDRVEGRTGVRLHSFATQKPRVGLESVVPAAASAGCVEMSSTSTTVSPAMSQRATAVHCGRW